MNPSRVSGWASDDSLNDLRRKIVKAGGDTGVLAFEADDPSRVRDDRIAAEIFRRIVAPADLY